MRNPTNEYYTIAVNQDVTYPVDRTAHVKDGKLDKEVQPGQSFLTTGLVIPDGHIIPYGQPEPPHESSIYRDGKTWGDALAFTWQGLQNEYTW